MKTYIITLSDCFGARRNATVKARSRSEAVDAVYKSDGEFVTVCRELD